MYKGRNSIRQNSVRTGYELDKKTVQKLMWERAAEVYSLGRSSRSSGSPNKEAKPRWTDRAALPT